ncbi:MAG: HAD family hydrolase [Candidatus Eisenbacteria bacterium]|uniref:HAD family hydrolase n=1 Tax=Eiseniibacteriota bacterium TaxID=2212470 RepID=A0A538SGM8_UNCEI|nr:MAG: HAD family hydrolase [Candidatus Eisenbacteria bacterium]
MGAEEGATERPSGASGIEWPGHKAKQHPINSDTLGPVNPAGTLSGIIFDMDGVLVDSEAFIAAAAIEMFRETYGLQVTRDGFAPFVGTGEDRFIAGVAELHGIRATLPRDKQRTYAIYLKLIRGKLRALPGAIEFARACRERGLKIAVATSADRIKLEGNLREIGLPAATFDAVVTRSADLRARLGTAGTPAAALSRDRGRAERAQGGQGGGLPLPGDHDHLRR